MCSRLTTTRKTEEITLQYNGPQVIKLHIHTSAQFLSQQKITFPHEHNNAQFCNTSIVNKKHLCNE